MSKGKRIREKRVKALTPKKHKGVFIQDEVDIEHVQLRKEYWITGYYFENKFPILIEPFCATIPFHSKWNIVNLDKINDYLEYSIANSFLKKGDKTMRIYEDRLSAIRFIESVENEKYLLDNFTKVMDNESLTEYLENKGDNA